MTVQILVTAGLKPVDVTSEHLVDESGESDTIERVDPGETSEFVATDEIAIRIEEVEDEEPAGAEAESGGGGHLPPPPAVAEG